MGFHIHYYIAGADAFQYDMNCYSPLLYSSIRDRDGRGRLIDVILPVTELDRANQIFGRMLYQEPKRREEQAPQREREKPAQERAGALQERQEQSVPRPQTDW